MHYSAAGLSKQERIASGLLLNARGAVGLVVAKVGLDAGLLAPHGYALLVAVIVVTTLLAPPALAWFRGWEQRRPTRAGMAPPARPVLRMQAK